RGAERAGARRRQLDPLKIDVQAEADDGVVQRIAAEPGGGQHAGDLPAVDEEVVRPLDPRLQARVQRYPAAEAETDRGGEQEELVRGQRRAQDERAEDRR